jgi:glutamate formiminotransferase
VFEAVRSQAASRGVSVVESEIVGLLPLESVVATARAQVKARQLGTNQIVEARLLQALGGGEPPAGA